jgi:hypothetical protein
MRQHKTQIKKKSVAHDIHQLNVERELQDDEMKLLELENKLKEVNQLCQYYYNELFMFADYFCRSENKKQ